MSRVLFLCLIPLVGLYLLGCGDGVEPGVPEGLGDYVGNLTDVSYLNRRGKPGRPSASGTPVALTDFQGSFVWAEYAAPWCGPCGPQAKTIGKLDGKIDGLVFLTIVTSEQGGYGHPATQATASRWAGTHGLDPARVVAADLTALTVPRHILYSPRGQVLFAREGTMDEAEIRTVAAQRMADWQTWADTDVKAEWMR